MEKIMLIIISVVMLFSACGNQTNNSVEESVQTQIDPAEEFGGITFGMTKDEIINFIGKEPYVITESDDNDLDYYTIWYMHEEYFNINDVCVIYWLKENDNALRRVEYSFSYDEYGQKQFKNAYEAVKDEILRRYPGEVQIDSRYNNYIAIEINTESRRVVIYANDNLYMDIQIDEYRPDIDSIRDIDI